ncbi:microtubule-associated protein futsch isoform X1 [Lucilia cuprina]|uniref:microtubule-associated protein futsch isoform X1 n=1 Tax=Lucilia cuprina TaxID=7375 RepID=UPI001F0668EE|nr:microtubule-associated protein futsch isoform X1 [Lucilia cuprina]
MASSMLTAAAAEVSGSASKEVDVDETLKSALHACANDPDFAIICDFLQKFSNDLGLDLPNFKLLMQWLTRTDEVSPQLREMQIKLLRKTRKTVHEKSWESALSKFCFTYSAHDAWEVERFGYKNASVKVKLRILRELLECQFERNTKFRAKILTLSADSLRSQPIGRDSLGHAYWVTQDNDCNIRIYQEHLDEEIWQVVATNRDEFVNLIKRLRGSEVVLPSADIGIVDEDTSSSSSSRTVNQPVQKPPPVEEDDSQEDEQKVPKLSIKLVHGKNLKEDVGKGEEELAAEEDAKQQKKSNNPAEANDSGEEEFEEVEEEYEDESGSEDETEDEEDDIDDENNAKKDKELEQKLEKDSKVKDENKKVKPLLISQNKVLNNESNTISTTNTCKKRALDQVDANSPPRNEGQQASALKKSRPSLMDSKRSTTLNKYEKSEEMGEEDYEEETDEEDADVEEEIEEEDIDSVAAEEDENEEKLFEDYDDDEEENEVGEEISDPVVRVTGEGSGKDCDVGNYLQFFDYVLNDDDKENGYDLSEEIVEDVFYVWGEGSGNECLVGNKNNDEGSPTNIATKNDAELLKTNVEAKSDTELEKSSPEDNKKTFTLSPKTPVPKDDVASADTTKLPESLEDKSLKPVESSEKTPMKNQVKHTEEKKQINGEDKTKELASKTETIDEKQTIPKETAVSKDNQKQSELKPNIDAPLKDNQISSKPTTILKTDSTKTDVISQQAHASKMSALESLKKELRESKQKILEKKSIASNESGTNKLASPAIYNRKRRLTDQLQTTPTKPPNSESEVDLNSENPEDMLNDQELGLEEDDDDVDVGGKRLKMRPKQTNSELRKKIEAKKVAANDETTSSSGGEEELRRRKKIILSKTAFSAALKTEEKPATIESIKDNNTANDNQTLTKIFEKSSNSTVNQQQTPIKKPTQITPTKVKPTLAEIIEKKLKKTPEKNDNDTTATTAKTLFPSPNKSPITKPLKKNLLTQIRQEESDEDAVPRKRTNSQDLNSQISSDIKIMETTTTEDSQDTKTNVAKIVTEKPRTTPERQRKRRSSEETVQHDSPEEPEAKKEVTAIVKDNEDSVNRDKPTETIKEEEIVSDSKNVEIKKESSTPVSGRRSGRRSGAAPIYVDNLQTKRNRGVGKNSTKKDLNDCDKVEAIKEEDPPSKETKTTNLKQDVKEKKIADKAPNDKNKSCSTTENVKEDVETKTVQSPTKSETVKQKSSPTTKTPAKGVRKQRDVDTTNIIDVDSETPVRQSRRIAQQKIREEAERRKLEEIALRTMKQELKKKKKAEKQADPTVVPPTEPSSESEDSDVETKKKVQKKKCPGKNGNWSSGSEEQEEPDEEDEEPPHYETDPGSPLFKSDHEFSPESDIEDESQVVPMKRARTVRKEDAEEDPEEEEACQKCNKSDHPEWILLCDNCDKGYHCSCLSPVLFYIPEGDWYCPPCQQEQLIKALENQLKEFDDLVENKKKEEEEVKRLAEEEKARLEMEEESKKHKNKKGRKTNAKRNKDNSSAEDHSHDDDDETSTNSDESVDSGKKKQSNKTKNKNRSKNSDKRNHRDRRHNATRSRRSRQQKRGSDSDSDSENSNKSKSESNSSSSSTYSESDNEPIYKLRKRRQINVSYRLNEYDDLINSALKKEMDEAAGAGNLGRGKDIYTIIEADKEEKARKKEIEDGDEEATVKPKEEEGKVNEVDVKETKEENSIKTEPKETTKEEKKEALVKEDDDSDAEPIMRKFNIKPSQKKKSRKLTTLDISSEDDNASDEDFKGSSLDDEDEEDTSTSASNSDSSLEIYKRHGKSKKKRRKAARRAFRERRKDRRFVVDESDDEDVQRPKSKKKRKDDSDYTESEGDDDISELSENIDSADLCDDTTTDESDGNWRPNKRKKAKKSSNTFAPKITQPKSSQVKKPKKVEYSDDDVSESEEDEDDDDDNDNIGSGKGMGKQPRSQPLKTTSSSSKTKGKGKEKPPTKTKKKKKSSDDDDVSQSDSEDSTRRTRGRRYAYIEDFDDDSSDGGIKPGVQRPDTPPEEREKFIKRQEEIKRMLAEKNAEGAKLVATPRLTPIKTDADKDKRSPTKTAGGDSLSTVPLSVIRQAKVLDIDYLQRRGENLDDLTADVGEVDDFDDADLPDDLPEDMDEDAIARMVEEEEEFDGAVARDLPTPDEVLKTTATVKPVKTRDIEKPVLPTTVASQFPTNSSHQSTPPTLPTSTASGLQEPVRKRLPMPTMHPPLLRHQYLMQESMSNTHHMMQRHGGPPTTSHLLQNALSAPLTQPLDRNYPGTPSPSHHSLINRMIHNIPLQPTISQALGAARPPPQSLPPQPSSILAKSSPLLGQPAQDKSTNPQPVTENKPRGRRKKITPLRDTLQKQQTAAAVTAATATNSALASATAKNSETIGTAGPSPLPPSVIKSGSPSKLPMQASVITSMPPTSHTVTSRPGGNMPPISGAYVRAEGPRFYDLPGNRMPQVGVPRHRGPPQMPPSLLPPHPANRSSYGPPPPLKGSSSGPSANPTSSSNSPGSIRNPMHHVPPPYLGMPPNARHAPPPHLNMYSRAPMYGNPNFGPRMNLRPPMHAPEYSTGSRAYPPYGFYPPPPPLTTPPGQRSGSGSAPRPPTQIPPISAALTQAPASVIVSAVTAKPTNTPTATPQPTPPPTPEITETKPSAIGHDSPIKTVSPKSSLSPKPVVAPQTEKSIIAAVPVAEPRKKLTTLQAYTTSTDKKSPVQPTGDSSGSQSSPAPTTEANDDSSTPGPTDNAATSEQTSAPDGQASEFSGLVSYFSSQHDDYNT